MPLRFQRVTHAPLEDPMSRSDLTRSLLLISLASGIVVGLLSGDPTALVLIGIVVASLALVLLTDRHRKKQKTREEGGLPVGLMTLYRRNRAVVDAREDAPQVLFLHGDAVAGLLPGVAHHCWVRGKVLHLFPVVPTVDSMQLYLWSGMYGAVIPFSRVAGFGQAAGGEQRTLLHLADQGDETLVFSHDALPVFRRLMPEKEGGES